MKDDRNRNQTPPQSLSSILLELARREEEIAAAEAAAVPYWGNHPTSVGGHRAATGALRSAADRYLGALS